MAISVASLTATLGLESGQFQSGLSQASGSLSKFSSDAQSHASSVGGAFEGISAKAVALGGVMANLATSALSGLAGAFGALKDGMIGGNAEFERYETQFGVLLGSASAAKDRLAELAQFGASTPFELPEVVRADKILQAFGLHSEESAKKFGMSGSQIRTIAGDVAAGTGAKFEEISSYLGKFSSGATGEAISRMQELGITTRAELASMGVEFSKSGEMTSPVEKGMSVLLQVMQSKFGGMMDAQSSTFEGMMSNLQDWVGAAQRTLGGPIFDALKGQLSGLLQALGSGQVQTALQSIGQSIGSAFAMLGPAIQGATSLIGPALSGIAGMMGGVVSTIQGAAAAIGPVIQGVVTTIQGAIQAAQAGMASGGVGGAASGFLRALGLDPGIAAQVASLLNGVVSAVQTGIGAIQSAIQGFQQAGAGGATFNLLTALGIPPDIANTIATTINNIITAVQGAFATLKSAISAAQSGLAAGPGVATINFLTALGLDEATAVQIGTAVANISTAIQNGMATIRAIIASFQTGGLAGGATAILQSLGLDPAIVPAAQALFALVASSIQNGISAVKAAIQGFQSGGVTGLLQALGLDPSIVTTITGVFTTLQGVVSTAITTIGAVIGSVAGFIISNWQSIAVAVGAAAAAFGILNVVIPIVGAIAGAVALLLSPIGLIAAAVGLLAAAWVSNFGNIQGIVGAVLPILGSLAGIVGGVLVGAFNILGAIVGFVAQHWQVFAAAAGAVVAALAGSGLAGIIGTIASVLGGLGTVVASAGGFLGVLGTIASTVVVPALGAIVAALSSPIVIIGLLAAAIGFLAVAWNTNMGGMRDKVMEFVGQAQAGWSNLTSNLGAVGAALKQAMTGDIGGAFATLQSTVAQNNATYASRMAELAATSRQAGSEVAGAVNEAAGAAGSGYGKMADDASTMSQIIKAVTSHNLGAIPGIVQGAIGAASANWSAGLNTMLANTQQAAFSFRSLLASMNGMSQQASLVAAQTSASPSDNNTERALTQLEARGQTVNQLKTKSQQIAAAAAEANKVAFTAGQAAGKVPVSLNAGAGAGGASGGGGGGGGGLKSTEEKMQQAAETISKITDTAMKLKEALANGLSGIMEGDGSNQIVAAAGKMAELGRRMYEEFSKAASGMSQDTDKAGQALGQAISTASSALGSLIGMLPKLWEFLKSDAWAEMSAVPGQVVSAAAKIIQIGAAIAQAFMGAMGNVSDEAAKSAQNGAAVVGAASQALTALVGMLPKLWEFINDPAFDEIMAARGQVVAAARKIIQLGKQIADAFLGAMGSVSDDTAKAAQNGAAVIGATTQSVSGLIDTIKKIVDFTSDVGYAAALFSSEGRANILRAADMLIQLGSAMLDMFVAAAGHVTQKATLAAKRFGEGLQSMGQGLTSVVDLITKLSGFLQDGMNAVFSVSPLMQTNLVGLATLMANLGAAMLNSFAQAGSQVSSLTVAAAKRLAEGIQAATGGITSVVDLVVKLGSFIQDGMNAVFSTSDAMQRNVIELARRLSVMALAIYANWVDAAATVAQIHVEAAKRLSDGVKAAVDGLTGALTFVTRAMEAMQDTALNATIAPGAAQAALVQFAQNLAQLARQIYNKWIDVAATVAQQHVDAAKKLSEGVLAGVSAITATLDFAERALEAMQYKALAAVVEPGKARDALLVFAENLSRLARDIYDNWVTVSATVAQQHVEAAKRLSEGVQAAISAVTGTMDVIAQLLTFASNSVYRAIAQSEGARAYFAALAANIMKLGAAIVAEFTKANIAIDTPVVNATKRFADAVSNVMAGLSSTIALVNTLVTLLQRGMPQVDATDLAARFVGPLVRIGVTLSTAANAAAQSLTGLDTTGLDKLKNVIGGLLDMFKGIADLVDYILGGEIPATLARIQATIDQVQQTLANVGVQMTVTPEALFHAILDPILAIGVTLTRVIAQGTEALSGLDTSGYDKLASVMGNAQETIQKIIDLSDFILDLFANGGLFDAATRIQTILNDLNARLASMGVGQASLRDLLHAMLDPILALGVALAQVAADATAVIADLNLGGLTKLNEAVSGLQTALENIPKLVKQILDSLAAGVPTVDPVAVATTLFNPLFALAIQLVQGANTAAAGIKDVATDAIEKLSGAISTVLNAVKTTLDLFKLLSQTLANGPLNMEGAEYHPEFVDALSTYASDLAASFLAVANRFEGEVTDAAKALGEAVNLTSGTVKTTLEMFDLFKKTLADGPLNMEGAEYHPEFASALAQYAMDVATEFLETASHFTGEVTDAAKALGEAAGMTIGVAKNALDTLALFKKTLADGPLNMEGAEYHPEFASALAQYAIDVATEFLATANHFRGEVTDAAKSLAEGVGMALGVAKNALDTLALFKKTLADGPLNMEGAEYHPEFASALAQYAIDVAEQFLETANHFRGQLTDASKALAEGVGQTLGVAKNALETLALFKKTLANGPLNMEGAEYHPEFASALAQYAIDVATEFLATANHFTGQVTDAAKTLAEAIGQTLGVAKNALETLTLFTKTLASGPLNMEGAEYHPEFASALAQYAMDVATEFLTTANGFRGAVSDNAKTLGEAIGATLNTVKSSLEVFSLFKETLAHGPLDMTGAEFHPEFAAAMAQYAIDISTEFLATANRFRGEVTDAAKALGEAVNLAMGVVKTVLEFNGLRSAIASFRPLDMNVLGPKIDLIFQAAKDLVERFVAKAQAANITKDMQAAADALAKVFGDAANTIKGALDMAAQLLDPATVIPSIGQIDAKLTAVLTLIGEVTQRFAAKAESIGPDTTKSAEGLANAVKSVFDAIDQVIEAVKAAADLYTGTAGFNNITGLLTTLFDTFDQFAGRTSNVEAVTAAITTLLGGIQALTADAGTTAGTSWAQQFAAAITANAGAIQGAIRGALAGPGGASSPTSGVTAGGGTGGSGGNTTINNTYDQRRTFNISVTNTTADAGHTTWAGIGGLVGYA